MEFFSVYVTTAGVEEARRLCRAVVEERLAACANILGEVESYFSWEGRVQQEKETAFILKTTASKLNRLIERLKELHSYQIPCIVAWPIKAGYQPYLDWVAKECVEQRA